MADNKFDLGDIIELDEGKRGKITCQVISITLEAEWGEYDVHEEWIYTLEDIYSGNITVGFEDDMTFIRKGKMGDNQPKVEPRVIKSEPINVNRLNNKKTRKEPKSDTIDYLDFETIGQGLAIVDDLMILDKMFGGKAYKNKIKKVEEKIIGINK